MPESLAISHPKKRAFLAAYVKTATVTKAAKAAGITARTHYEWNATDPEYAKAFEQAKAEAVDHMEAEAIHRATIGDWVPKFHNGEMVMVPEMDEEGNIIEGPDGEPRMVPYLERKKSDTLLIFMLKGACPEKYAERSKIDVKREYTEEDLERFARQHGLDRLTKAITD